MGDKEHEHWLEEFSWLYIGLCIVCGKHETKGYLCSGCWEIAKRSEDICSYCSGSGNDNSVPKEPGPCSMCHGSGFDISAIRMKVGEKL